MRLFVLLTTWVKFGSTLETPVDCNLPACSTDNCDVVQVDCELTCTNGVFGGTGDKDCAGDKTKLGDCDNSACGSVVDCVFDACPANTCGGEVISCSKTCDSATFGDPGCPLIDQTKEMTCPVQLCSDCTQACSLDDCTLQEFKCNDANNDEITKSCGFAECADAKTLDKNVGYLVGCSPTGMSVVILDSVFAGIGITPDKTTLRGAIVPPCVIISYSIGFMYYYVPLVKDICGTTAESDEENIKFMNQVLGVPVAIGGINRGSEFELDFNCEFKTHELLSIGPITPEMQKVSFEDTQTGNFVAKMGLYTDLNYNVPLSMPYIVKVPELLYAGVKFESGTPLQITVQLQKCWATPTNDGQDPVQKLLIDNYKSVDPGTTIETSLPSVAEFTTESFIWEATVSTSTEVFLNCDVFKCDTSINADCKKSRRRRRGMDAADENFTTFQIGPISNTV